MLYYFWVLIWDCCDLRTLAIDRWCSPILLILLFVVFILSPGGGGWPSCQFPANECGHCITLVGEHLVYFPGVYIFEVPLQLGGAELSAVVWHCPKTNKSLYVFCKTLSLPPLSATPIAGRLLSELAWISFQWWNCFVTAHDVHLISKHLHYRRILAWSFH